MIVELERNLSHNGSFLLGYLINNANSWCKVNDNSIIIAIFANKICENRLHLGIKQAFCTRFALFLSDSFKCI